MEIDDMSEHSDGYIDGVKMPDRIWLVWEGGEVTWCDDPDPSGHTEEAVAYTRTPDPLLERLLAAGRDALDLMDAENPMMDDEPEYTELSAALDAYDVGGE
jgi:hypothetical protein